MLLYKRTILYFIYLVVKELIEYSLIISQLRDSERITTAGLDKRKLLFGNSYLYYSLAGFF